jgi:hypothetical protein
MKKLLIAFTTIAVLGSVADAKAPLCRDAKGKFTKCPTAAAAPVNVTKDAKGKCHFASGPKKGQFTKCP